MSADGAAFKPKKAELAPHDRKSKGTHLDKVHDTDVGRVYRGVLARGVGRRRRSSEEREGNLNHTMRCCCGQTTLPNCEKETVATPAPASEA